MNENPACTTLSNIHERVGKLPTIAAVDALMREVWGRYTGAPGEDEVVETINNAATARRHELRELAQAGAVKRVAANAVRHSRFPPPLPSIRLTPPEKREAADRRRGLADFLVHQVPAAFIERLPQCGAARAVLAAICQFCARDRNRCDAAINTIAEKAGVCRSSVNQALRLLEELGLISIDSGRLRGTVSVIRVLATPLAKLVAYCRSRLGRWKQHRAEKSPEQLSFFGGGVQKCSQKEDSNITYSSKRAANGEPSHKLSRKIESTRGTKPAIGWATGRFSPSVGSA